MISSKISIMISVISMISSMIPYRYKMLNAKTWPSWKGRPLDGVREILKVPTQQSYSIAISHLSILRVWVRVRGTMPVDGPRYLSVTPRLCLLWRE